MFVPQSPTGDPTEELTGGTSFNAALVIIPQGADKCVTGLGRTPQLASHLTVLLP